MYNGGLGLSSYLLNILSLSVFSRLYQGKIIIRKVNNANMV